ncbi:uncharacterized protein B0T23DRAFT_393490 [Neurospora hispaniola]|uniref:Uncharacterized protein n=1 Tax=Neurospora hispaniola TaxID=588809 RepID=A0AAJ0ICX8_9PEZI|nr:hypothetical protein B0T23DRAFT_393490 [Neurospora hispaniola]
MLAFKEVINFLVLKPNLYLDKICAFLANEYNVINNLRGYIVTRMDIGTTRYKRVRGYSLSGAGGSSNERRLKIEAVPEEVIAASDYRISNRTAGSISSIFTKIYRVRGSRCYSTGGCYAQRRHAWKGAYSNRLFDSETRMNPEFDEDDFDNPTITRTPTRKDAANTSKSPTKRSNNPPTNDGNDYEESLYLLNKNNNNDANVDSVDNFDILPSPTTFRVKKTPSNNTPDQARDNSPRLLITKKLRSVPDF